MCFFDGGCDENATGDADGTRGAKAEPNAEPDPGEAIPPAQSLKKPSPRRQPRQYSTS